MFIILLKFSEKKGKAGEFMEAHKEWLKRGFDDGIFLMAGSIQPNLGGGVLAHRISLFELQQRVSADPFVQENIVIAEIIEITPSRMDDRLKDIFS